MKVSSVVIVGLFLAAAASAQPSGAAGGSEATTRTDATEAASTNEIAQPGEAEATPSDPAAASASRPVTERRVCRRAEPLPGALTGRRVCRTVRESTPRQGQ